MKKRFGFVTNSSSSCFICQISGNDCSGWDMSLSDCGMSKCENGHTFLDKYLLDIELTERDKADYLIAHYVDWVNKYNEWFEYDKDSYWKKQAELYSRKIEELSNTNHSDFDNFEDDYYEFVMDIGLSEKLCPICQLEHILPEDMLEFTMWFFGINENEIKASMRKFSNLGVLKKSISD